MTDGARGKLKIYLGYAAGVGKTYQMLLDAQELKAHGVDVAIGYFEPHGRQDTISKTEGLEIVPRKTLDYRGTKLEEMNTDAILARRPTVCVVDEFPHTNVPGSERQKRWEDVLVLLDAGIDVLTTMNIQHLESLNDQVWQFTGVRVRETIPDWVVQQADEVVMVDVTPRALLNRLERGVVYKRDKAEQALQNFFRESTLVALRELAMRQTAYEVEQRTPEIRDQRERILVLVTPAPETAMLIRRAKRVSDFLGAECFAVCVQEGGDLGNLNQHDREEIERHLNFARNLHIETRILDGTDVAPVLVDFARRNHITQLFLARPGAKTPPWFRRDLVQQIVHTASDIQIVIVSERDRIT